MKMNAMLVSALLLVARPPALAQSPGAFALSGVVDKVDTTEISVTVVDGSNSLKVKFTGGESELVLDPGVPVVRIEPVAPDLVKSGVKVRLQGVRTADGASVSRITIR